MQASLLLCILPPRASLFTHELTYLARPAQADLVKRSAAAHVVATQSPVFWASMTACMT